MTVTSVPARLGLFAALLVLCAAGSWTIGGSVQLKSPPPWFAVPSQPYDSGTSGPIADLRTTNHQEHE
jgi:hypothetical protein